MSWYENIPSQMNQGKNYPRRELLSWMEKAKPGLSLSGYHWAVTQLIKNGAIIRTGHDEYSLKDQRSLRNFIPHYSEEAAVLMEKISKKFPYVSFTVFETVLMNNFLNHLIAQNTIFLQVERESSIYIFRYLQDEGIPRLMYKPSKEDFRLYWEAGTVVVIDLVTESPLCPARPHDMTLEKMLVDMCAEKLIAATFSKAELPNVFELANDEYVIDKTKMTRYARRRNKEDEIRKYLKGE